MLLERLGLHQCQGKYGEDCGKKLSVYSIVGFRVRFPLGPGDSQDLAIGKYQQRLVSTYWQLVSTMVLHGRDDRNMTPSECQAWIQRGLALTPFCGHVMNTSLEWAVGLVIGGRMDYSYNILAPQRRMAKARTSEKSYLSV